MNLRNILWGLVLISLGIILGINALDIFYIDIFFAGWWTLFIIVPCFIGLLGSQDKLWNLIGLLIGILLLLGCNDIIDFALIWKLIVPIILIMVGISCIFKNTSFQEEAVINKSQDNEYVAAFAGQNLDFAHEEFKGCQLSSLFGGIQCHLKEAKIVDQSVIEVRSIFGGTVIFVPDDVEVKVTATPIFGGVSQKRSNPHDAKKTIYIRALCIFGGVEIRS